MISRESLYMVEGVRDLSFQLASCESRRTCSRSPMVRQASSTARNRTCSGLRRPGSTSGPIRSSDCISQMTSQLMSDVEYSEKLRKPIVSPQGLVQLRRQKKDEYQSLMLEWTNNQISSATNDSLSYSIFSLRYGPKSPNL